MFKRYEITHGRKGFWIRSCWYDIYWVELNTSCLKSRIDNRVSTDAAIEDDSLVPIFVWNRVTSFTVNSQSLSYDTNNRLLRSRIERKPCRKQDYL